MDFKLSDEEYKIIRIQYESETEAAKYNLTKAAQELIRSSVSHKKIIESINLINSAFINNTISKPSEFFTGEYKCIIDSYIPVQFRKAFVYSIDNMNKWQYSSSSARHPARTSDYAPHIKEIITQINDFRDIGIYKCKIHNIVSGNMPDKMLAYRTRSSSASNEFLLSNIIAAELDTGNIKLEKVLTNIVLGKNLISPLTTDLIRGIIRSRNEKLHKLLGNCLASSKLSENTRQAICENIDCGTTEAFITLLDIIRKNDLIRYQSVRRSAAVWTGIFDEQSFERINNKILDQIYYSLTDENLRRKNLDSDDSVELYCSLWAYGFYDVKQTINIMCDILKTGFKNRILVLSHYLKNIEWKYVQRVISKSAIETYYHDNEIFACFLHSYMDESFYLLTNTIFNTQNGVNTERYDKRCRCDILKIFENIEEAERHYSILLSVLHKMNDRKIIFSPCIFPWHSMVLQKTDIISRLCFIANALDDNEKCDEICRYIPEVDISSGHKSRKIFILALLAAPETPVQRKMLINFLEDRELYSREAAFNIIKHIDLTPDEYLEAEKLFRLKTPDIRTQTSSLLYKQNDNELFETIRRLASEKTEELRTGALDLMLTLSSDSKRNQCFEKCLTNIELIKKPSTMEQILIDEITSGASSQKIIRQKGFGLYNPDIDYKIPLIDLNNDTEIYCSVFSNSSVGKSNSGKLMTIFNDILSGALDTPALPDYYSALKKLDNYINTHRDTPYSISNGENIVLLGSDNDLINSEGKTFNEKIALPKLWEDFYKNEGLSFPLLLKMYIFLESKLNIRETIFWDEQFKHLFGNDFFKYGVDFRYPRHLFSVVSALFNEHYDTKLILSLSKVVIHYIASGMPQDKLIFRYKNDFGDTQEIIMVYNHIFNIFFNGLNFLYAVTQKSKKDIFNIILILCERYKNSNPLISKDHHCLLSFPDYISACIYGIFSVDYLYKVFFEIMKPGRSLREMSFQYLNDTLELSPEYTKMRNEIFTNTSDLILSVELKRGDTQTAVSQYIYDIKIIFGVDKLVAILSALGKETINKSQFYKSYNDSHNELTISKKNSLSHMLSVCVPKENDTAELLGELLKNTDITEQRLLETAMYNPAWIKIIEDHLKWSSFTQSCYYFIAHIKEHFNNKEKSMISKFTPVTPEELSSGVFDIKWFKETYISLGEKRFKAMYKAAKYISDSSTYIRAGKYADAVCGKLDTDKIKNEISKKRNKDSLMAFSLIPLKSDTDISERYKLIQSFIKESSQFGSQRRASETAAAKTALHNLSLNAGFSDITHFNLKINPAITETKSELFSPVVIDDISVRLSIDESGKPDIECIGKVRRFKSIPSKLKKNEYFMELQENFNILSEQYSGTKLMLERSMEDRRFFTVAEINAISKNPVIKPLTENLIYICNDKTGLLRDDSLVTSSGKKHPLTETDKIIIAHPLELQVSGKLHKYQSYFFKNKIVQPFRQLFRELFFKDDSESDSDILSEYTGIYINPVETIRYLQTKRWTANNKTGLQRVFFPENIIAELNAKSDWFSPSDSNPTTIDNIQFYDRKALTPLTVEMIPDYIFSEVFRDIYIAADTAHATAVEYKICHSVVEIRKTIAELTMRMFRISNVAFENNIVIINGTKAKYSVDLENGDVHWFGGAKINVPEIQPLRRKKFFIPYSDEDPKLTEILLKLIMFARDKNITDQFVLSQIRYCANKSESKPKEC